MRPFGVATCRCLMSLHSSMPAGNDYIVECESNASPVPQWHPLPWRSRQLLHASRQVGPHHVQLSTHRRCCCTADRQGRATLVIMAGDGHNTHGKQKQPLIKMPHRSDQKKIMLGLQVTHQLLLCLHPNVCNGTAPGAASSAMLVENLAMCSHIHQSFNTCRCQCGSQSTARF